jgi:hypothetical protein
MKGFVAVVRRELVARRLAFVAAAALSAIPFAVPLSRGLSGAAAGEFRETTAMLLAAGFAAVLSVVLGWSALSRDLAERRLGFDFSRPLSGFSIWAGRLAGAFVVAVGSGAIVWLPSWIPGRRVSVLIDLPRWAPWAVLAGSACLVLVFTVAGIVLRSHSALLLGIVLLTAQLRAAIEPLKVNDLRQQELIPHSHLPIRIPGHPGYISHHHGIQLPGGIDILVRKDSLQNLVTGNLLEEIHWIWNLQPFIIEDQCPLQTSFQRLAGEQVGLKDSKAFVGIGFDPQPRAFLC